jgi:hypothetical protein
MKQSGKEILAVKLGRPVILNYIFLQNYIQKAL